MKKFITVFTLKFIEKLKIVFETVILLILLTSFTNSQQLAPIISNGPIELGQSVVTSHDDFNSNYNVVRVIDIRNIPPFITGGHYWNTPLQYVGADWTKARMRNVYGIALDASTPPNIFIASSTVYCDSIDPTDSILIYRIDGDDWTVTNYVCKKFIPGPPQTGLGIDWIANTGSNLGNLCYDNFHKQIFATNHEDGRIYCIRDNGLGRGAVHSWFDPPGTNVDTDAGFVPKGERLWGIGTYGTNATNVRVYFSRWNSDRVISTNAGINQIWSIALTNIGDYIPSSLRLEIDLPLLPSLSFSNPVSDIEFAFNGDMICGERTMFADMGPCFSTNGDFAHRSRILEYPRHPLLGSYSNFIWHKMGLVSIGPSDPAYKSNSSGGVDFDYGFSDSVSNMYSVCDSTIVGTGDYLFSPNTNQYVYGVQVTERSSAGVSNVEDFLNSLISTEI
ncbi:MAG: hypothetical protein IPL53_05640 [Ignavibacteria bacterium]|nr:hypothetical protein [Ignavibacteria bacterium]